MTTIPWKLIKYSTMSGVWAAIGDRRVEVVECYPGLWTILPTVSEHICEMRTPQTTYHQAIALATSFLLGITDYPVWPVRRVRIVNE